MNIIDIKVMKGPNYWSVRRHHLIVMRLDLDEMEERPTNTIDGFLERLKAWRWEPGWVMLLNISPSKFKPWLEWIVALDVPAKPVPKGFTT